MRPIATQVLVSRRSSAKLFGAMAVAMGAGGCDEVVTYRRRVTIELDIDGKTVRGVSVIEQEHRFGDLRWLGFDSGFADSYQGEAITFDLGRWDTGKRKLLFALLPSGGEPRMVFWKRQPRAALSWRVVTNLAENRNERGIDYLRRLSQVKGVFDIPERALPAMVTFSDPADPATVEEVDPRDIGATFPGVSLQRATMEVVRNVPITRGIDKYLPWLEAYYGKYFAPVPPKSRDRDLAFAQRMTADWFRRWPR